jgi:hypothetical protein
LLFKRVEITCVKSVIKGLITDLNSSRKLDIFLSKSSSGGEWLVSLDCFEVA